MASMRGCPRDWVQLLQAVVTSRSVNEVRISLEMAVVSALGCELSNRQRVSVGKVISVGKVKPVGKVRPVGDP